MDMSAKGCIQIVNYDPWCIQELFLIYDMVILVDVHNMYDLFIKLSKLTLWVNNLSRHMKSISTTMEIQLKVQVYIKQYNFVTVSVRWFATQPSYKFIYDDKVVLGGSLLGILRM